MKSCGNCKWFVRVKNNNIGGLCDYYGWKCRPDYMKNNCKEWKGIKYKRENHERRKQ